MVLRMNGQKRNIHMIALCFLRQHPSLGIVCFDKGLIGIFNLALAPSKSPFLAHVIASTAKALAFPALMISPIVI